MKNLLQTLPIVILLLAITSCNSVKVVYDYDKNANFDTYKTFAFYKPGIDKAEINGIDKRRILRSIESNMLAKGFTKSDTPDLLVSFFTKSRKEINVYNNYGGYGYGWGWSPYYWNNYNTVSESTQGLLYIDLIDAKKKELVWQGTGTGYITQSTNKKEERIKEFVYKIFEKYPPGLE